MIGFTYLLYDLVDLLIRPDFRMIVKPDFYVIVKVGSHGVICPVRFVRTSLK